MKAICPICGAKPAPEFKPFCSRGCKDRDLLQWLGEGYRVPGPAADEGMQKSSDYGLDSDAD